MGKVSARILSILFHPMLLPSIGILILFNSGSILDFLPFQAKKIILLIVFVSTCILPLTFVPFFIFQKIIKNVQMENNKERLIPFFVTSILYFFCYYMLRRLGAPQTIVLFVLAAAINVFTLFLLSFKYKISAHMAGIGGLTGALIAISFILKINLEYFIIGAIIVSGIIGYSRLKLETHKQYQIYIGWFTGLIISSVILFLF
ncbi:MAG: hypothetical protein KAR57_00285 [Bacteroidales bacterium]|nr:hypothetical protein [Bacteroidales bacterium]